MLDKTKIFSDALLNATAYPVADVPQGMLKLDAMEFPQDFPEELRAGFAKRLAAVALNRYPPAKHKNIEKLLRKNFSIDENFGLLLGNGSDEIIQMLVYAAAWENAAILSVAPTFVMYRNCANFAGVDYFSVDLNADFSLNVEAFKAAIQDKKPNLIFLAVPNNPTGVVFSAEAVAEVIEAAKDALFIIDEAYQAFSGGNLQEFAARYPNVLILRTLSKVGFAGARFGYLFGRRELIDEIEKIRPPYNINVMTAAAIEYALENYAEIQNASAKIPLLRKELAEEISKINGIEVFPSNTNFLVLRVTNSDECFTKLKEAGILVKNLNAQHQLLANCLRITVSFNDDNERLLSALKNIFTE